MEWRCPGPLRKLVSVGAVLAVSLAAVLAVSAPVGAIPLPGVPTNVAATGGPASAILTWDPPVSNGGAITGYVITPYILLSHAPLQSIDVGDVLTDMVTGLSNGTTYVFTVAAMNSAGTGNASADSDPVTPKAVLPGAPTIGTATAGIASATVTWTAPTSNGGSPITGYVVTPYVGTTSQSPVAVGDVSSTVVTDLAEGTTYTFTVAAVNIEGTGPASGASNPVTPASVPDAPAIGTATAGHGSAAVTWTAPTSDGGSPIIGYVITPYVGTTAQTPVAVGTVLSDVVTGLTNGTTYTFTVAATNAVGTGSPSAQSNPVTPMGVDPGAPTIGTATAGNTTATVNWTAPASDGGSPITGYSITPYKSGVAQASVKVGAVLSDVVTGLTNGSTYTFTVAAINAVGTGSPSAPSNPVTPATLPGAPTIGTATAGNTTATVTWTAPASDGGSPIIGYSITPIKAGVAQAPVAVGTVLSDVVTGLTDGTSYTFTVAAINAVGTGPVSAQSKAVTPGATLPGAPTIGTAAAGNTTATVNWTAPASDGGSPITGYSITPYKGGVAQASVKVGAVLSDVVTGLTDGTSYTFTVAAINTVGTGPPSAQSNVVTPIATVPGAPTIGTPTPGNASALVTWTPPASDGGSPIISYLVTASPGGQSCTYTVAKPEVDSCTVTGLTNNSHYSFTVAATNKIGTGPSSNSSVSVIPRLIVDGYLVYPGANLAGADLNGADLSGIDLAKVNFTGADLTGVDFTGANLTHAVFTDAAIGGTTFTGATLTGVASGGITGTPLALISGWFVVDGYLVGTGANLTDAQLVSADLAGDTLTGTNLTKANLTGANLTGTNLTGANLTGATLSNALVTGTNLTDAALNAANLTDAALNAANLTDAVLTSADLLNADLYKVILTGATLTSANLDDVQSGGITGTPAALPSGWSVVDGYLVGPGADLTDAVLTGAALGGIDLNNAILSGVVSGGITGVPSELPLGWKLVDGYLVGPSADLLDAGLSHANLTGANLRGATLTGADLTDANLTNANLAGAVMTHAIVTGVIWKNTTCPDSTNSSTDGGTCVGHGA